jgi:hypothetical protein
MRKTASDSNSVDTPDDDVYTIIKPLTDETTISDVVTISVIKTITDDTQPSDDTILTFNRLELDSVNASDIVEDYTDNTGATGYFLETYAATTSISFS